MRLPGSKKRFLFFSIVISAGYLYTSAVAQDTTESKANAAIEQSTQNEATQTEATNTETTPKTKLFGCGGTISYVAPYMWKGIPITKGPCIQQTYWASVWELRLGMFINMFGSNKDRNWNLKQMQVLNVVLDTNPCSQRLGMINQCNFFLDWKHIFNKYFSLQAAYTQYAYGEYSLRDSLTKLIKSYEWFNKNITYGELTVTPFITLGIVKVFTEQNLVILASKRTYLYIDTTANLYPFEENKLWSYDSKYGCIIEKELSGNLTVSATLWEEIANRRFFTSFLRDPATNRTVDTWGFYQTSLDLASRYAPRRWFALSANYGMEFFTNRYISNYTEVKGAQMFGGIHTTFYW